MTAINLPGQVELPIVVDHQKTNNKAQFAMAGQQSGASANCNPWANAVPGSSSYAVQIAKLLKSYEDRPTSETWSRIQALASEILK